MRNPVRGEWWIDDSGTALYADGDVGDMGHEAYVIEGLTRRFLDNLDVEYHEDSVGSFGEGTYQKQIKENARENGYKDIEDFIYEETKHLFPEKGQWEDAYDVMRNIGGMDARMYGMKYDGWKRVQGHNIETWALTTADLKHISDGIYDASGDDIVDEDEFNIYVFSTKMWYENVPWSVLSEDDPGKLRIYGTKDNPPRVLSYAEAHRWEPLAKSRGVSAVARSERGFMRMYQRAGTWDNVNDHWRRRRAAFIARHMAQGRHETLWKRDRGGKLQPSRRCLALIMWGYKPR